MDISKRQQLIVFFIWLVVVPSTFYISYTYFPSEEFNWSNGALLFALMILTMLMPIQFQSVTISLERWVTFTIFFQYGVFAEYIFVQLAMLVLLFTVKSALPISHRFFVNSSIFAVVSIVSGLLFHSVGGTIGSLDFSEVFLFGLLFAISYTALNNILLKTYFHFNDRAYSLRSRGALWDYIATMIMLPFSISLYFLQVHLNNKSLLLVGIPFLLVLIVARMYNRSNDLNMQLTNAGDIGHELADQLSYDEVLETFLKKLKDVVRFDNAYVVDLQAGVGLRILLGSESGDITKQVKGILLHGNKTTDDGLEPDVSKIYHNAKEVKALKNIEFVNPTASVMTVPIKRNLKTEGFLLLTSNKKNSFQPIEMKLIDILAGYFGISLEKARYFESTIEESLRCGLTKLHNFRYLDAKLGEETIRYHTKDITSLSVLMMDIDHFKRINDTFGHESGNDLLCDLSSVLQNYVGEEETLARYGGEEFVIVLPNTSKEHAAELAEMIRKEVEETSFTVIPDLSIDRTPIKVNMTVSIGVATLPDDASDIKDLMRNADRALYIGGKQAGRNKVGVYGDEVMTSTL